MAQKGGSETKAGYRLSFSTGGLFVAASVELAGMYQRLEDWEAVKKAAAEEGLTQFSASSSITRTVRELATRLAALNDDERDLLLRSGHAERSALLWLALCRTYPLIREFAVEVVSDRLTNFRTQLGLEHFDAFIASKSQWNSAIADLSDTTLKKLRQNLFRYMREAGIILEDGTIVPYLVPAAVRSLIEKQDPSELAYYPGVRGAV